MNITSRKFVPFFQLLALCSFVYLLAACAPGQATTTGASQPTPTPIPTQAPTPTPSVKLALTMACPNGFGPNEGDHERVCVRTSAGASLTIQASYCRGNADQSDDLKGTFTADQTGYYEWNWTPKAICENPPGHSGFWQGTVRVTATLDGQTVTNGMDFLV